MAALLAAGLCGAAAGQSPAPAAAAVTPPLSPAAQSYAEYELGKFAELQAETHGGGTYIEQALTHYKAAMAADPNSAFLASQMADLLSRLGRADDAIELEQATLKQHPDSLVAHQTLGTIYLRELSRLPQPITAGPGAQTMAAAITEYKTLAGLQPKNAAPVVVLGKLYGAEGQPAQAEQEFRAALEIEPTNLDAIASLIQSLASEGALDKAQQAIDALPPEARSGQVYATLGEAYERERRYTDAAKSYRQAVAAQPDDPDFQGALAQALMDGGDYAAALTEYQRLQRQTPDDGHTALRVAQLEMQLGQFGAAKTALDSARALLPADDIETAYATVLLEEGQGDDMAAAAGLHALLARPAGKASKAIFLDQLARLEMRAGDSAGALDSLQQMEALGASYRARAHAREIELYSEDRDYSHALATARAALAEQPGSRPLHITYANLLAASGHSQEALAALQPLLQGDASDWDVYLAMSQIRLAAQQYPEALAAAAKADALAATPAAHAQAANEQAAIEAQEKEYDAAERSLRHALALEPGDAASLNALGYLLAQQGKQLPQALDYVQQALAHDPNNGAYLDSLGWIYFKMNRMPEAVSQLERAVHFERHDPAILDHLAQAYDRDGKLQQAATSWTQALEDLKGTPENTRDAARRVEIQKKLEAVKVRLAQAGEIKNR